MGGFYERLVGSVKRCFKKALGRHMVTGDQLNTILIEAEAVVNSRPLTVVDPDLTARKAITPNDLIGNFNVVGTPAFQSDGHDPDYIERPDSAQRVHQFWKRSQEQLNQFWKIWKEDYLQSLRERREVMLKQARSTSSIPPVIGEVVLVGGDKSPRGTWKLGRILELIPSSDGAIRSARVQVDGRSWLRSITQLYPLECTTPADVERGQCETPPKCASSSSNDPLSSPLIPMLPTSDNSDAVQPTSTSPRRFRQAKDLAKK